MDPITLFIVQLILQVAVAGIKTLIDQATAKTEEQAESGVQGSIAVGGDVPLSIIVGRYGTAGYLEYAGTHGNAGKTPNAYYSKVISVSDMPVRGLVGLFVNGERVTIGGVADGDLGFPVTEYFAGGVNHLWVKFYDGTQTIADPLLLAKFGSDPDYPWLSDMIGRGVAYAVVTALVNRELFPGFPDYFFEVDGVTLNEGTQDNPVGMIRQSLSGFYYGDEWVWGLQNLPATRLPSVNWEAQADKCDLPIDLAGGGTEPQFRAGAEIRVDQQPIEVIPEFLKSCEGRIAEIGGIYKVLVGPPDEPVYSFTDEDVIITAGQSFTPFPGLENTYNQIKGTYVEPEQKWGTKDLPAYVPGIEDEDDDRHLPADVTFNYVYSGTQAQRIMRAMLGEERRFRTHSHTMPPEVWEFEPLDCFAWNSARNGYSDKLFLLFGMDDLPNANQVVALKELDPADYDPPDDLEPLDVVPLVIHRPPPLEVSGFSVAPAELVDAGGTGRRPAIDVFWDGDQPDLRAVRITIRLAADESLVWEGSSPQPDLGDARIGQNLLPLTAYEVQIEYQMFGAGATEPSAWLPVTTLDIRISDSDLTDALIDDQLWIREGVREIKTRVDEIVKRTVDQDFANFADKQQLRTELTTRVGEVEANYTLLVTTAINEVEDALTAVSQRVETLEVTYPDLASITSVSAIDLRLTVAENTITLHGTSIDSIAAELPGKATVAATNALDVRLTETESGLLTAGTSVRDLRTTVDLTAMGAVNQDFANFADKTALRQATANVFEYASTQIELVNGELTLLADLVQGVETSVDEMSASGTFRMTAGYTPASGWTSRIGMEARVGTSDVFKAAGLYLEATTAHSRVIIDADVIALMTGGVVAGLFENGQSYFNKSYIRNLTAINIEAKSIDADEILIDGTLVTDLIAEGAVAILGVGETAADVIGGVVDTTLTSTTVTVDGGAVVINIQSLVETGAGDRKPIFRVYRDATLVREMIGNFVLSSGGNPDKAFLTSYTLRDASPGVGSVTYYLKVSSWNNGMHHTNNMIVITNHKRAG